MRLGQADSSHLTYCTNIHPGESWHEVYRNLEVHVARVKALVCPNAPFGVGLRLSAAAASAMLHGTGGRPIEDLLSEHDLYVYTINGFPYGAFHGAAVKHEVYRPDWTNEARLAYTIELADLLARILRDNLVAYGSISTVPVGWRHDLGEEQAVDAATDHLLRCAAHLSRLRERTGREIVVALEPEPGCLLETTADAAAFFENRLFCASARSRFSRLTGLGNDQAEEGLRRHLGVCLDACHVAVQFEDAEDAVAVLRRAGIRIAKAQLSTGLCVRRFDQPTVEALRAFDDGVYLHQVVELMGDRSSAGGTKELRSRYDDLPLAISRLNDARRLAPPQEWRIHFHVPIFREALGCFDNTQPFLRDLLALHRRESVSDHLEVETYTWQVIPADLRSGSVAEDVANELAWVLAETQR
jgi:hypothetical protein